MNSSIIVIEHTSSSISNQLKCQKLAYNNQSKDEDIHRWLIANKSLLINAQKLIIRIRLGEEDTEYMGLYVGLHIRLTRELDNVRFLPILFVAEDTRETILENQMNNLKEKSGLLLFTKGSYLIPAFDLEEFITKDIKSITETILIDNVIPNLDIENTKDSGHQLANDWGAFRLAKFAGYSLSVKKPTSIFFKYKDSFTKNEVDPDSNTRIGVLKQSCKALLIDDNSDSGWSEVLGYILKNKIVMPGMSTSLSTIKTFKEAMEFDDYINYDIVFLDLRLIKEEDKGNQINNIQDFSGTKVLKKIKEINHGIQVIIFTASNKVWNIEKLREIGADGYYIKESPEYVLNESFSRENYKELLATVERALNLKYLRNVNTISQKCIGSIKSNRSIKSTTYKSFYDRTLASFEIAFQLLGKTNLDGKYLNFAFLTYFQIVEDYVNQRENFEYVSKKECYVDSSRVRVIDDTTGKLIWKLTFKQDRIIGDFFEVLDEIKPDETQIQTLAKVSFVLAFKFHKDNLYLRKWSILNNIRNTKAGHGGANGFVTSANIGELLEIIELILT